MALKPFITILILQIISYPTYSTKTSTDLDYTDPEKWTHLSQNILLHDLEPVEPDPHHIRHFTNKNIRNKSKGPKKGNRKGQRQNGNGNSSYNNKSKQALRFLKGISNNYIKTTSYNNNGNGGAWPGIFNVALKAAISANATCGEKGREKYCKIIDARPHKSRVPVEQCYFCDNNSQEIDERHLIENAIDGSPRWWQSPSLSTGMENEYVTITMDLGHIYQIISVMLKAVTSPRPASWILEKSLDGDSFVPWQYFGISNDDCLHRYGLPGVLPSKHWFRTDDEIVCSDEYSKPTPLENSEVQISLVNGRPGHNTSSLDLLDFTLARYIRFRFQGMYMTQDSGVRWLVNDEELLKRSYYSLRHIVIGGRCVCNGHAAKCRINENDTEGFPKCECIHNTCGDHCDKCCPLYNQRPYRPGNTTHENRCEKCQCYGHATECRYSVDIEERGLSINTKGKVSGGGVCVNCKHNTTGINCEKCLPGFYRPEGVPANDPQPCRLCNCNPEGIERECDGIGGKCYCKEGFTGERCDRCQPGYRGSKCVKCGCNKHGTMDGGECESHCQCKLHVEGEYCDKCETGYFGLHADNHEGCIKCFCSGVTSICKSWSTLKFSMYESYENWHVTDISNTIIEYPVTDLSTGFLVVGMYELEQEAVYWSAPRAYLGNKLTSYGSHFLFKVDWVVVRGDTSGKPTNGPNIILIGKNGLKIAYGDESFESSNATIDTRLTEDGWYHVPKTVKDIVTRQRRTEYKGDPVTRVQFMSVLAHIDAVLLRATYHTDQAECILRKSMLYVGGAKEESDEQSLVEECDCPVGYTGTSCETCAFGYIKVYHNTTTHEHVGKCFPCNCNGHAETCDMETGRCGECQHDTEGETCDRCKPGFYGNALDGTPNDCKKCSCPLPDASNNFSPTCRVKDLALDHNYLEKNWPVNTLTSDYICTACPLGYHGDHCEYCDDGYYGTPTELGSQCLPCPCNGGPCDPITGLCITCEGNTEGWRCEKCKSGFWGNATEGCLECECYEQGAASNVCDRTTGHCDCRDRYSGVHCQECDLGYANLSEDCAPCECHTNGSESHVCDPDTGLCVCKPGVYGPKCDNCLEEYFNMTIDGCEGCNCHIHGSLDRVCDHTTGQCKCRPHVTGRRCEKCTKGYWNIDSAQGCVPCVCNLQGSVDQACDMYSGQCFCKEGVTGVACDHCSAGYWGFAQNGCKACDLCDTPAKVCDPDTGRCVCPPLSTGPDCQVCMSNTFGWEFQKGCRYCQCDRIGAIGQTCHNITGQCDCREGYAGHKCDTCAPGYYNYPECKRCDCDPRGSLDENGGDVIECDDLGQCPCKELVTGLKCNRCRKATFGLNEFNPQGCSRCFCFGRSQDCHESDLSWGQLRYYGSRNLSVEYIVPYNSPEHDHEYVVVIQLEGSKANQEDAEIKRKNGLHLIPSSTGNVSIGSYGAFSEPFYFQLPPQFLGDQTTSYGGMLNFTIQSYGGGSALPYETLMNFPLIQIHSHHDFILNYFGPEILETSLNASYSIRFHEQHWKYHFDGKHISRAIFMTALENIKHIFLRATTSIDFTQVVISDITLDTAIPVQGSTTNLATSIEVCNCDIMYDSLSCQSPADGYYRFRTPNSSEILEDLVGYVLPCSCNNRSDRCDKETGYCYNCRDNTGGASCETCAEGYYGNPNYGCQACPCPETRKNFAKGCIVSNNDVRCICKQGYTGRLCEKCEYGYFGNPQHVNGSCIECGCNRDGIVSDECDEETGQCNCKPGIIGRKCDKCELPRHYLEADKCRLCDDCSQTLLDTIDELIFDFEQKTEHLDLHGIPAPWLKLNEYINETQYWTNKFNQFDTAKYQIENFDEKPIEKLDSKSTNLKNKLEKMASKSEKLHHKASKLNEASESLLTDIRDTSDQIHHTIQLLDAYGTHDHHIQLPLALKEANLTLQEIKYQYDSVTPINSTAAVCANKYHEMWTNVSSQVQTQHNRLTEFKRQVHELGGRVEDMKRISLKILDMESEIQKDNDEIEKYSRVLNEKFNEIEDMKSDIKEIFSDTLNADSDVFLQLFKQNLQKIDQDVQLISALRAEIEDLMEENEDLLKDAKTFDLPRAQDHAQVLERRANDYTALFADTRERASDAMSAIQAYDNITETIRAARIAAKEAHGEAEVANRKIYPEDDISIIERGLKSLHESNKIKDEIMGEMDRLSDLRETLDYHQRTVADVNSTIWHCAVKDSKITSALNAYSAERESVKEIRQAIDISSKISDEMREVHRHAMDIGSDVYKLKNKLKTLDPEWDIKFGGAEENLTTVQSNLRVANQTLENIEFKFREQNQKFLKWQENFLQKTQELRDKIALAKHAAEGIHVSVESSKPNCIRSYVPKTFGPTTSTHITMTFALKSNRLTSAPLLFIKGEGTQFIALEMINKQIHLVWNLGGKVQKLTNNFSIEAHDAKLDESWYQVELNRTLNVAVLSVKRMGESGKYINGKVVSGASDRTRFTYDGSSRIWLGSVPEEDKPDELKAPNNPLNIILHQIVIDGETIGLWNFASTIGMCKGAIMGPSEAITSDNARGFNGHGYAVLKANARISTKASFAVRMVFRTLDENALLFLAVDDKSNATLSLTLSQGRIFFRVNYEGDTRLELNTLERYNTGEWITVDIARQFTEQKEHGSITVVGIPVTQTPIPDTNTLPYRDQGSPNRPVTDYSKLPNFQNTNYYIGGVPPGFNISTIKALGVDNSFLGCMKDVQIGNEAREILETTNHYGVAASCTQTITKAGFYGNGYIELPAHSLKKRANVAFVFRTLKPNALLLLGAHPQHLSESLTETRAVPGNFSVNLLQGRINVKLDAGKGPIILTSNLTLNDGEFHVVSVSKTGRKFELHINDEHQSTQSFAEPPFLVNLPDDNKGGLYVGGAPMFDEFLAFTSLEPFEGAIKDLVFNNKSISFDTFISFTNVHMGRDGPKMRNDIGNMMKTEPFRSGCNRVGSYSYEPNGFKFGDAPFSYSETKIPTRNLWQRNFYIQTDFRTFYPNGILFVAPGTKEKQKHYIMLTLRDGTITLIVRGRKKQSLNLPVQVNDGQWHRVILHAYNRTVTLSVTVNHKNTHAQQIKIPKKLNASNKIFVGGLPDEALHLPSELVSKLEGFKGCLRKFSVNNVTQDLAKLNAHKNVGQCFPRVEKGSYFPGDAYGIYKRNFNVGRVLELQLEYKTSELNGILLSVSDKDGFPALSLEMNNGNIVFSCDLGDGIPLRAIKSMDSKYALCNNKWHTVYALYDSEQIFVRVDNLTSAHDVTPNRSNKIQTKSPLYIGGIPEQASQGTLLSRENFKGCINNVVIRGDIKDWTDYDYLHNILLNECPATQ